jgi:ABC-type uncharacterized transport system substrate-binding protein
VERGKGTTLAMKGFFAGATVLLILGVMPAHAHPHVFVNNKMIITFDAGMLQGISFKWTFDDMFSNMILSDYDPRHTGQFDAAQIKAVKEGAFDNLENYHYFIAFVSGNKPINHFKIEKFTPSVMEKSKLVYTFFVPLKVPVTPTGQSVRVTVYDDSYYVAFDLLHLEDVSVQAGEDVVCDLSVEKTKVKPLWPGQFMPDQLVIKFKGNS